MSKFTKIFRKELDLAKSTHISRKLVLKMGSFPIWHFAIPPCFCVLILQICLFRKHRSLQQTLHATQYLKARVDHLPDIIRKALADPAVIDAICFTELQLAPWITNDDVSEFIKTDDMISQLILSVCTPAELHYGTACFYTPGVPSSGQPIPFFWTEFYYEGKLYIAYCQHGLLIVQPQSEFLARHFCRDISQCSSSCTYALVARRLVKS